MRCGRCMQHPRHWAGTVDGGEHWVIDGRLVKKLDEIVIASQKRDC